MNTDEPLNVEPELAVPPAPPADWLLQHLAAMVTGTPLEIGVTLQVSGMLVSGRLVSGVRYFDGIASDFAQGLAAYPDLAESMRESFERFGKLIYETKPEKDGEDRSLPPPNYIHLREARFFNTIGSPIPSSKGVWWRGRISEVGGFCLGEMQFQAG